MKLNHKFKLIPVDENEARLESLKEDVSKLMSNRKIQPFEKMALFEGLIQQLQRHKKELGEIKPIPTVQTPRTDLIPDYKLSTVEKGMWERMPGLRTNDKEEVVIDGQVIPGSNWKSILDYTKGKSKVEPYGYRHVADVLERYGFKHYTTPAKPKPPARPVDDRESDFNTSPKSPTQPPDSKESTFSATPKASTAPKTSTTPKSAATPTSTATPKTKRKRKQTQKFSPDWSDFETPRISPAVRVGGVRRSGTRKSGRKKQAGTGLKRLYIKVW